MSLLLLLFVGVWGDVDFVVGISAIDVVFAAIVDAVVVVVAAAIVVEFPTSNHHHLSIFIEIVCIKSFHVAQT